jgi:hypothetical protein
MESSYQTHVIKNDVFSPLDLRNRIRCRGTLSAGTGDMNMGFFRCKIIATQRNGTETILSIQLGGKQI